VQHLLPVLCDVLRNPIRAQLVESVPQWPWSSLQHPTLADPLPVPLPADWLHWIEHPLFDHELTALRTCLNRQAPFGSSDWLAQFTGVACPDSLLRHAAGPAKLRISSLSSFVFQRLTDSH
jgi:putative transposase